MIIFGPGHCSQTHSQVHSGKGFHGDHPVDDLAQDLVGFSQEESSIFLGVTGENLGLEFYLALVPALSSKITLCNIVLVSRVTSGRFIVLGFCFSTASNFGVSL